jgi:hypothetical protein
VEFGPFLRILAGMVVALLTHEESKALSFICYCYKIVEERESYEKTDLSANVLGA